MIFRTALLYLSRQHRLKTVVSELPGFRQVVRRFVAGETITEAIAAVRELNRLGIMATLDHLGESITSEAATQQEVAEYQHALQLIAEAQVNSNISVKLTQLGLDIDEELCLRNTRQLVEAAARNQNFVLIDMEDSLRTDVTLRIFRTLRTQFDNVGIVLQAYLYRSEQDLQDVLALGSRVRLCKGAYKEDEEVAFPLKSDVDANFVKLMQRLLVSGLYHGIATHDEAMIAATKAFAAQAQIAPDAFEFQMLYGVRRDLQVKLVADGYRVRVYVPYGGAWYPYFMRRLAERPANLWFVLKNLIKG
ncbi:MAG TPA: proline dehydrogenase family protein [Blastocatellia bacterium]|nr:proline dehydrogenase family protein [Blastocatellia bacterium]